MEDVSWESACLDCMKLWTDLQCCSKPDVVSTCNLGTAWDCLKKQNNNNKQTKPNRIFIEGLTWEQVPTLFCFLVAFLMVVNNAINMFSSGQNPTSHLCGSSYHPSWCLEGDCILTRAHTASVWSFVYSLLSSSSLLPCWFSDHIRIQFQPKSEELYNTKCINPMSTIGG